MGGRVVVNRTDRYYRGIDSAEHAIENELTVSHMLKDRNPFTREGKPFGRMVFKRLKIPEGSEILEVGPGEGHLAKEITAGLKDFHYTFVDVSPVFIGRLKEKFAGERFNFVNADFLEAKIRERFDFIICNEVLADFPTVVNMRFSGPSLCEEDREIYYETISLNELYGLGLRNGSNFNYGAVKFLEKAARLLKHGGKAFVCEHSSDRPRRIRVYGHSEYTIDFGVLDKVAGKLGLKAGKGKLTGLLGMKKKKAVIPYLQPELKVLYNFFKGLGSALEQRPYTTDELLDVLEGNGVSFSDRKGYGKFLGRCEKPLSNVTDQFRYMILERQGPGAQLA